MFTVCPKCALTLAVTTADLRIAQGYVRCGRCLNVFNALARLSEERPAAAAEPPPESAAADPEEPHVPDAAAQAPEPSPSVDDTGEIEFELDPSILVTSVRPPVEPVPPTEPEAHAAEASPAAAAPGPSEPPPVAAAAAEAPAQDTPAELLTPVPGGPDGANAPGSSTQTPSPPSPAASPAASPAPSSAASPAPSPAASPSPSSPAAPSPAATSAAQQTNTAPQQADGTFGLGSRRPPAGLAWKLGAGALVIVLALQIVNHYRDSLAASPALRGPLSAVYAALGVKLAPNWNIHAYDVRQLGASVAGTTAGEIVVHASVKNGASRAQPLPLLRVTLQDRFGNRIAARDVPPNDYLPKSVAPGALLAAGSRVDATMVFVDPGPQAVGFEIDACLRRQSGEVACAHGPR